MDNLLIKTLANRVKNIMIKPRSEWQVIKDEPGSYGRIIRTYVCILAAIPPAAAVAGGIILNGHISNLTLASPVLYLLLTNILWYGMYVLNVVIVGAIITVIVVSPVSRLSGIEGLKLAAHSFTPLFIAGFIGVFPRMGWIIDAAIVYSIYLLYLGIVTLASLTRKQAAWYALGSFLSAAVVVGFLNLIEYLFESSVMNKVLF